MSELKPCPFCGSVAIPTSYPDRGDAFIYRVECSHNCAAGDCSASTNMMATQEAAAEAWNTRPPCAACAVKDEALIKIDTLIWRDIIRESLTWHGDKSPHEIIKAALDGTTPSQEDKK